MSTLRANHIADLSGYKPPGFAKGDTVKTWVAVNGVAAPAALIAAHNITSLVDAGVGVYNLYLNYFMNTVYTALAGQRLMANPISSGSQIATRGNGVFDIGTIEGGVLTDASYAYATIFGVVT
jgi:hypothetical protein